MNLICSHVANEVLEAIMKLFSKFTTIVTESDALGIYAFPQNLIVVRIYTGRCSCNSVDLYYPTSHRLRLSEIVPENHAVPLRSKSWLQLNAYRKM